MRNVYQYTGKNLEEWKLSDYERGQLEMLIDGEGNISMYKSKRKRCKRGHVFQTRVDIVNTSRTLLERAKVICGGGAITPMTGKLREKMEREGRWSRGFHYRMPVSAQRALLPQLSLIVKEEQRLLVLEALGILKPGKGHSDYEEVLLEAIYQDLKELNGSVS